MSELKPCPFCGGVFEIVRGGIDPESVVYRHVTDALCPMERHGMDGIVFTSRAELVEALNARPIEDAQAARIAELEAENEHLRDTRQDPFDQIEQLTNQLQIEAEARRVASSVALDLQRQLDAAQSELAALREQARWIPVEERRPGTVSPDYPYSDSVWAVDEHGEISMAYYEPHRDEWYDLLHRPLDYEITHWRPIVGPEAQ